MLRSFMTPTTTAGRALGAAVAGLSAVCAWAASAPAAAAADKVTLELNKLEPQDKGSCRAWLVVGNDSATSYQTFKIELIMFRPDGVIGKRFALDLAPVRPSKKTVKLFDLDGVSCDQVGSLLLNDVMDCKTDAGAADDCLARLELSSLGQVKISK